MGKAGRKPVIGSTPNPPTAEKSSRYSLPAHHWFPEAKCSKDYMAHNPAVVGSNPTLA